MQTDLHMTLTLTIYNICHQTLGVHTSLYRQAYVGMNICMNTKITFCFAFQKSLILICKFIFIATAWLKQLFCMYYLNCSNKCYVVFQKFTENREISIGLFIMKGLHLQR